MKEKDLTYKEPKRIIKYNYSTEKVTISDLLYKTIKIFHFEFIPSKYNKDKLMLVAQIAYKDNILGLIYRTLFTESIQIVKILKEESEINQNIYYYSKIIRPKNYYFLSKPNMNEKKDLLKLTDPYPIK